MYDDEIISKEYCEQEKFLLMIINKKIKYKRKTDFLIIWSA